MHKPLAEPPVIPDGVFSPRDQLLLLWEHRLWIVGAALVLGAVAAALSLLQPRVYESAATLAVNEARLAEGQPATRVEPAAFVPLLESRTLAGEVVSSLGLDQPPHGLSASTLLGGTVTVRAVPDTNLIRVVARASSPDLAARIANRYAERGVAAALKASRVDVDSVEQELKTMLSEAETRRTAAEREYETYRADAQLELVEKEVSTLLDQRAELMKVNVKLEAERARLQRLEGELANRDRLVALRQSVVDEPAVAEAVRDRAGTRELLGLEMRRETQNPVFFNLDEEAATVRAEVSALEQERARLARSAGVSGTELQRLNQLYERQSKLQRLAAELRLAQKAYEDVAAKYMGARLAAVGRLPQITVIDAAAAPDDAVSRFLARNVALGLAVGGLLACAVVLMRQALA